MLKIGLIGHIKLADPIHVKNEIENCIREILNKRFINTFEAFSGMAAGADTLFAELVLNKFNAPLHAVLAFDEAKFMNCFTNPEDKEISKALTNRAKCKQIVSPSIDDSDDSIRKDAYMKAGEYIVDQCDIIIAVWDGKEAKGKGGTADIIQYAREKDKELQIIQSEKSYTYTLSDLEKAKSLRSALAPKLKFWYSVSWILGLIFLLLTAWCLSYIVCSHCEKSELYKLNILEGILFALAVIFIQLANSKKRKRNRINARFEAETFRYMIPLIKAGIPLRAVVSVKNNFGDYEFEIHEEVIKMEELFITNYDVQNIDYAKNILQAELLQRQFDFHSKREHKSESILKRIERFTFLLTILFFIGIGLHVLYGAIGYKWIVGFEQFEHKIHDIGIGLTLFIPPLFATVEAYKYFSEIEKFIGESINYKAYLQQQIEYLQNKDFTSEELIQFANKIREILTLENRNWYMLMLYKERGSIS